MNVASEAVLLMGSGPKLPTLNMMSVMGEVWKGADSGILPKQNQLTISPSGIPGIFPLLFVSQGR